MAWQETIDALEKGTLRAAIHTGDHWVADEKVKAEILSAFKAGKLAGYSGIYDGFVDKDNLPPRYFEPVEGVRLVPGGSAVRRGAYIAEGVVIMPPSYINTGAYIGAGSMIDSHVLVGSCAQIGKNVHLSAGVQIGGVLEPVGMNPVIIEDDCFLGAGSVVVEGVLVKSGAVIAPGVILSKSIPVYDCVREVILGKGAAIPAGAVVIPGTRPAGTSWATELGLSVSCPLIIKYRDHGTDASLELEEALR